MKKILLFSTVCFVCILGALYFGVSSYISSASRKMLPKIKEQIESETPFVVESLDFEKSKLTSLDEISLMGVEGALIVGEHPFLKKGTRFEFYAHRIGLKTKDYNFKNFVVRGQGFSIEGRGDIKPKDFNKLFPESNSFRDGELVISNFRYEINLPEESSAESIEKFSLERISGLYDVLEDGLLPEDFVFEGVLNIALRSKNYRLRLHWVEEGDAKKIVLLENDLDKVTADFRTWLTRDEIKIVSRNPLKAPKLLQIKYYAEKKADEIVKDDEVEGTRDAYRYILWSYLLSKEFGVELAKKVTDAHESAVPYQSNEAKRMDIVNGGVGRKYFLAGVAEGDLLSKVLSDPEVVRIDKTL